MSFAPHSARRPPPCPFAGRTTLLVLPWDNIQKDHANNMTSTNGARSPTPLSGEQNQYLKALWNCHSRELIDSNVEVEQEIPSNAYTFCVRLHSFFRAFLDPKVPRTTFLKDSFRSSLYVYHSFRLRYGRHVIALHHGNFLGELNRFETQSQDVPVAFVQRNSFGAFLHHMPEQALKAIGCSMVLAKLSSDPDKYVHRTQIFVRFHHVQPSVPMMNVKTSLVGKLVTVKGHVVKARPKRLSAVCGDFQCLKCRSTIPHPFIKARYSAPTKCSNPQCRSRSFSLLRSSVRYIDAQEIRLQEAQEENTAAAGRTPRQMEVEFTHDDMVDKCRPGDIVQIAAIVSAVNTAEGQRRAKESTTYKLYLEGHSVSTTSESNNKNRRSKHTNSVTFTPKQLANITELCHADHFYFGMRERRAYPFDLLVRSLCPAIIGHNEVKAGLLLCLLGGTPPATSEKGNAIRSNAHILVVGDPGMGKYLYLNALVKLSQSLQPLQNREEPNALSSNTTGCTKRLCRRQHVFHDRSHRLIDERRTRRNWNRSRSFSIGGSRHMCH